MQDYRANCNYSDCHTTDHDQNIVPRTQVHNQSMIAAHTANFLTIELVSCTVQHMKRKLKCVCKFLLTLTVIFPLLLASSRSAKVIKNGSLRSFPELARVLQQKNKVTYGHRNYP